MRPPHADTSSPPIPLSRDLLRQYFTQVLIRYQQVGHGNTVHNDAVGAVVISRLDFPLLHFGRGQRSCLDRLFRRNWHEEVNLATLELSVWRNDDDLGDDAAVIGRRGRGLLEHVLGVRLHDLAGADGAADLFHSAVAVNDSDHVESSAW